MATIRCAAGRSLLRQSPRLLRRAAGGKAVGPRAFHSLVHRPAALPPSSSMAACVVPSGRHISSWAYEKETRKRLAVEIMNADTWNGLEADEEIRSLDELLHRIKSNLDTKEKESQLIMLRSELEKKKQEVAMVLLKEDGGEEECRQKKEELVAATHRLRQALSPYPLGPELRELRDKYKLLEGRHESLVFWIGICGMPVAWATLMTFCR